MPTTIQEIADILHLPYSTVANVLNARDDRTISAATRETVLQAAARMGYKPVPEATENRNKPTGQLGLWMSSIYTAFHAQIINQVETNVRAAGYQLIIRSLQHGLDGEVLPERNLDGCLAFECAEQVSDLVDRVHLRGVPTVCMGGVNCRVSTMDSVEIDLSAGTFKALSHLGAIGCNAIAYLGPDMPDSRLAAYYKFCQDNNQQPTTILTPSQSKRQARHAVLEFVTQGITFDGIFCFNDDMAIACISGLRDAGLNVPNDVAVVGCDGIEEGGLCEPPITSLAMPADEMCRLALTLLHDRMVDSGLPVRHRQLTPSLVLRDSSNRTAAGTLL